MRQFAKSKGLYSSLSHRSFGSGRTFLTKRATNAASMLQLNTWTHTFNFTVSQQNFTPVFFNFSPFEPMGSYVNGVGWQHEDLTTGSGYKSRTLCLNRMFSESIITNVTIDYDLTRGIQNGYNLGAQICVNRAAPDGVYDVSSLNQGTNLTLSWNGFKKATFIQVFIDSHGDNAPHAGSSLLRSVTVTGIGDNPFTAWTKNLNFLTSSHDFYNIIPGTYGTWVNGVGWQGTDASGGQSVYIGYNFPRKTHIYSFASTIDYSGNSGNYGVTFDAVNAVNSIGSSNTNYNWAGEGLFSSIVINPSSSLVQGGLVKLINATIVGEGYNPFETWTKNFDFTDYENDFIVMRGSSAGQYTDGAGFVSGQGSLNGTPVTGIYIEKVLASNSGLKNISFNYTGGGGVENLTGVLIPPGAPHTVLDRISNASTRNPKTHNYNFPASGLFNGSNIRLEIINQEGVLVSPSGTITSVALSGIGYNDYKWATIKNNLVVTPVELFDSGIDIVSGGWYHIKSGGTWAYDDQNPGSFSNGDGATEDIGIALLLPSHNIGKLIAKIGNGSWFGIGRERTFYAESSGRLYFAMNDVYGGTSGNTGTLNVTIRSQGIQPEAFALKIHAQASPNTASSRYFRVYEGLQYRMFASGSWKPDVVNTCGVTGYAADPGGGVVLISPGNNVGALVAKIGNGAWFAVGTDYTFTPSESAIIQFAVNDIDLPVTQKDNSGYLQLQVFQTRS